MNFVNTQYLVYIILSAIVFAVLVGYLNSIYFRWVKSFWFFERTWASRISAFFYIASITLMIFSLLDLRGPEEKVKSALPDQRTIIVLDSSASMLAEDIRPSRFGKAIQLARHFVKNAAGHQISIVLFSDIQKRLVPFTDDIDLLDSRLAALENTNMVSGGSNISQAISEVVGYFDFDEDQKSSIGNVLVFTDAEESEGDFTIDLQSNINLAIVGVGTAKGGYIPLRWEDGSFRGYKTSKGNTITTRLDESFIKNIGKNVKSYKYWIANSYSLPTDEIFQFFKGSYNKVHGKGDVRIRPVYSYMILIPAIILYCLSVVVGRLPVFKVMLVITILTLFAPGQFSMAQDDQTDEKKLSPAVARDLERMKKGSTNRKQTLKIAEELLRNNEDAKANELYSEYSKENDEDEVIFNQVTALLKLDKLDEALPLAQDFYKRSKDEEMKNKMRHNIILAMNKEKNKKENKKNEKDKEGKDTDKNKEQSDDGKEGKEGKGQKNDQEKKSKNDEAKNGKDQKKPSSKDSGEPEKKDQNNNKDPKDLEKPERENNKPKSLEEKEKMIEQKRKMVKTPAMVKQILNDDRDLQKKMMDTSTNERGSAKPKRDW